MKCVLFLTIIIILFSCKKDNRKPEVEPVGSFEDVIGKYLICDSVVSNVTGILVREIKGKGAGLDMTIHANHTISVYTSTTFTLVLNYELRKPDSLFNWHIGAWIHPEGYTLVKIPTKKKFSMLQKLEDKYREYFYTAE